MKWFGWGEDERSEESARIPEQSVAEARAEFERYRQTAIYSICASMMRYGVSVNEVEDVLKSRLERTLEELRKTQRK